jgi:hypothetical protein
MVRLPKHCPACDTKLVVTRLSCPECGTEVNGSFPPDLFSRLEQNEFDFVVLFLRTKGNVKEMERELGISYWTIRSKLSDIVTRLGLDEVSTDSPDSIDLRQEILDQLNQGLISVQEAASQLEKLRNK